MPDPTVLPKFPTQFGESETKRMQELEKKRKEYSDIYLRRHTPEQWGKMGLPEKAIRETTEQFAPSLFGLTDLIMENVTPESWGIDLGLTPEEVVANRLELEEEYQEMVRKQKVVTLLPDIMDAVQYLAVVGHPIVDTTELGSRFKVIGLYFNDEETEWVTNFAQSIAQKSPKEIIEGGFDVSDIDLWDWLAANQDELSPNQIMSTVAFSKDIPEIAEALQLAYPPVDELGNPLESEQKLGGLTDTEVDDRAAKLEESLLRTLKEKYGIEPKEGETAVEALQRYYDGLAEGGGQVIIMIDDESGEPVPFVLREGDVWDENNKLIAHYDEDTEEFLPLTLEEAFLADNEPKEATLPIDYIAQIYPHLRYETLKDLASIPFYSDKKLRYQAIVDWVQETFPDIYGDVTEDSYIVEFYHDMLQKVKRAIPKKGLLGFVETAGKSVLAGYGDMWKTLGGATKMMGWDGGAKKMYEMGEFVTPNVVDTMGEFQWSHLLNPNFYAQRVVRTVPTTAHLMLVGMWGWAGGAALAGPVATKAGLGTFGSTILRTIFGGVTGGVMSRTTESMMEAGGVLDAQLAEGASWDEAHEAANEAFWGNMKLAGLDAVQLATIFAPSANALKNFARGINRGLFKLGTVAGKTTIVGLTEGGEELYQNVVYNIATGEEDPWAFDADAKEAFIIGTMMGVGFGASGAIINRMIETTKEHMTPSDKADFDSRVEELKEQLMKDGVEDEPATAAAEKEALDEFAETERGEELVASVAGAVMEDDLNTKITDVYKRTYNRQIALHEADIEELEGEIETISNSIIAKQDRIYALEQSGSPTGIVEEKAAVDHLKENLKLTQDQIDARRTQLSELKKVAEVRVPATKAEIESWEHLTWGEGIEVEDRETVLEYLRGLPTSIRKMVKGFEINPEFLTEGGIRTTRASWMPDDGIIRAQDKETLLDPEVMFHEVAHGIIGQAFEDGDTSFLDVYASIHVGRRHKGEAINWDKVRGNLPELEKIYKDDKNWHKLSPGMKLDNAFYHIDEYNELEEAFADDFSEYVRGRLPRRTGQNGLAFFEQFFPREEGVGPDPHTKLSDEEFSQASEPQAEEWVDFSYKRFENPFYSGKYNPRNPSLDEQITFQEAALAEREDIAKHIKSDKVRKVAQEQGKRFLTNMQNQLAEAQERVSQEDATKEDKDDPKAIKKQFTNLSKLTHIPRQRLIEGGWDGLPPFDRFRLSMPFIGDKSIEYKMQWNFLDSRFVFAAYEAATGLPFYLVNQRIRDGKGQVEQMRDKYADRYEKIKGFHRIKGDKAAKTRIAQYINAQDPDSGVQEPENLSDLERQVGNQIMAIFNEFKPVVRMLRFLEAYEQHPELEAMHKDIPDAPIEELEAAKIIYEGEGEQNLWAYLYDKTWGVRESGYDPRIIFNPNLFARVNPISSSRGSGRLIQRENLQLDQAGHEMSAIFARLDSYIHSVGIRWFLRREIMAMADLFDMAAPKFDKPKLVETFIRTYLTEVQGIAQEGGMLDHTLRRVYQMAAPVIFWHPWLCFRNVVQPLWGFPFRTELFRGLVEFRKLPADFRLKSRIFFDTEVDQSGRSIRDYMYQEENIGSSGKLPTAVEGTSRFLLKPLWGLSRLANRTSQFPLSDKISRNVGYHSALNKTYRVTNRYLRDGNLDRWMRRSGIQSPLLTQVERDNILRLLAQERISLSIPGLENLTGPEAASLRLAQSLTDTSLYMYDRSSRSSLEWKGSGRTLGSLLVFPRSTVQMYALQASKIFSSETSPMERIDAVKNVALLLVAGEVMSAFLIGLSGKKRKEYGFLEIINWELGGLTLGLAQDVMGGVNEVIQAMAGDKSMKERALAALPATVSRLGNTFVGFYKITLDSIETMTDTRGLDMQYIRKLRGWLDENYTPEEQEDIERSLLEQLQHAFTGSEAPDPQLWEETTSTLKDLEDSLGTRDMGKFYTLKELGNDASKLTKFFPIDMVSEEYGFSRLVEFYKESEDMWWEYLELPTKTDIGEMKGRDLRKEWRLSHLEEEARMLFWGKYDRPVDGLSTNDLQSIIDMLLIWFDQFDIDPQYEHPHFTSWVLPIREGEEPIPELDDAGY